MIAPGRKGSQAYAANINPSQRPALGAMPLRQIIPGGDAVNKLRARSFRFCRACRGFVFFFLFCGANNLDLIRQV